MRRHKACGKAGKTQCRKTLKRRNTAKVPRSRKPSTERIALLTRERDKALEQRAANAWVGVSAQGEP
jgi:hypothetical protein